MKNIILIGGGGHAKVVIETILKLGEYEIKGVIDMNKHVGDIIYSSDNDCVRVIGSQLSDVIIKTIKNVFVCIGDNYTRKQIVEQLISNHKDLKFPSFIDNSAIISSTAQIGKGVVILPGSVANAYVRIGDFCILNTKSSVDHDTILESFTFIGPGATLCGTIHVREDSFIGAGCTILPNITIGCKSIVGAHSIVTKNVDSQSIVYGIPAKNKKTMN
jgi:sugar O-acyltransferase (sialic acid O-acetyltransferase NeuD family)